MGKLFDKYGKYIGLNRGLAKPITADELKELAKKKAKDK